VRAVQINREPLKSQLAIKAGRRKFGKSCVGPTIFEKVSLMSIRGIKKQVSAVRTRVVTIKRRWAERVGITVNACRASILELTHFSVRAVRMACIKRKESMIGKVQDNNPESRLEEIDFGRIDLGGWIDLGG
jgi:hypothetical protein